VVLLNAFNDGGFFFNIVTANVNDFQWQLVILHLRQTVLIMPVLAVVGALYMRIGPVHLECLAINRPYSIAATLTGLTIGQVGSNVNYLLEMGAALSIAVGLPVPTPRTSSGRAVRAPPIAHLSGQIAVLGTCTPRGDGTTRSILPNLALSFRSSGAARQPSAPRVLASLRAAPRQAFEEADEGAFIGPEAHRV
jgi:hypothetical protein